MAENQNENYQGRPTGSKRRGGGNGKFWTLIVIFILLIIIIVGWYSMRNRLWNQENGNNPAATSSEEMGTTSNMGNEGSQTGPTEETGNGQEGSTAQAPNTNAVFISVSEPTQGEAVSGDEFAIKGQARGSWFFEGSFSAELLDSNGNVLATQEVKTTAPNWMTTDFIPFEATFDLSGVSYTGPATLVLQKANPSGLPENGSSTAILVVIQ